MSIRPRPFSFLIVVLLLAVTAGCTWSKVKRNYDKTKDFVFDSKPTTAPLYEDDDTPIIDLNYEAADELISDLSNDVDETAVIHIRSFINIADAGDPSPFGRIVAEQVASRLSQKDYRIAPPSRYKPMAAPAPVAESNSTMALDKDGPPPDVPCELTGSYLIGADVIYVSAQIARLTDGTVLAGYQWTLPVNKNTMTLLPQLRRPGGGTTPSVRTTL
ncbi:MAG: FlgO family outer membrane protein [Desulfovibrionaceae bacterium]